MPKKHIFILAVIIFSLVAFILVKTLRDRDMGNPQLLVQDDQKKLEGVTMKQYKREGVMDESHMKGFLMQEGKMMIIWDDNSTTLLDKEMTLKSGMMTIRMDGSLMWATGSQAQLHNGEAMMMDWTMKKASDLNLKINEKGNGER